MTDPRDAERAQAFLTTIVHAIRPEYDFAEIRNALVRQFSEVRASTASTAARAEKLERVAECARDASKRLQQVDNCRYARQLPKCECHNHGIVVKKSLDSALTALGEGKP